MQTVRKTLLGEVGIGCNVSGHLKQLLGVAHKHPQVPAYKGIRVFHAFGASRLASAQLVGERLLCLEEYGLSGMGIDSRYAQNLQPSLHGRCAARPEVTYAGSLLSSFADEARVNGQSYKMVVAERQERAVEGNPVKRLPEVLAETALARPAEAGHLCEVYLFADGEIHFHCLGEEGNERFAYICHTVKGGFDCLAELDERSDKHE